MDRFASRHQDLAAHMSAFLRGRKLILEMHACSACIDHVLHQLKRVQHSAEAGFRIGDDGQEPVNRIIAFRAVDLISSSQSGVDCANQVGRAVGRIQALIGIHLACAI